MDLHKALLDIVAILAGASSAATFWLATGKTKSSQTRMRMRWACIVSVAVILSCYLSFVLFLRNDKTDVTIQGVRPPTIDVTASAERLPDIWDSVRPILKELQNESHEYRFVVHRVRTLDMAGSIFLLKPYGTSRTSRPAFAWMNPRDVSTVRLRVIDVSENLVWEKEIDSEATSYPEDLPVLEEGQTYFWDVVSVPEGKAKSTRGYFRVLKEAETKQLELYLADAVIAGTEPGRPRSTSAMTTAVLLHFEALGEARDLLEKSIEQNPNDMQLNRLLRHVYSEMGIPLRDDEKTKNQGS